MSGSIPISKDGGLEPHLCFCPQCGGDTGEMTIGVVYEALLTNGSKAYYNRGDRRSVTKNLPAGIYIESTRHVEDGEKLPSSAPCAACQNVNAEMDQVVADGGVHFRCTQCGSIGVIKDSPFAKSIRERAKVKAPDPVGVEFADCRQHKSSD